MHNIRSCLVPGGLGLLIAALALPAHAGRDVEIDAGNDPTITPPSASTYSNSGVYYLLDNTDSPLTIFGNYIPLNFGTGAPASRRLVQDARGEILFVDASGNPTGDFIAPLLAPAGFAPSSGMSKAEGDVDPGILGPNPVPGPYNYANSRSAYRFTWSSVCPIGVNCGGNNFTFQLVLVNLGPDSFLIDFNYGDFNPVAAGLTAGFSLNGVARSFAGPYSDVGPSYCFVGGQLGSYGGGTRCTLGTSSVPEPATAALFVGGIGLMAGARVRRRRNPVA